MDNSKSINRLVRQNKINLMNDSKYGFEIGNIMVTNYVEIPVPKEICGVASSPDDTIIKSGSKWIIVFVGGDITKPRAIARYID